MNLTKVWEHIADVLAYLDPYLGLIQIVILIIQIVRLFVLLCPGPPFAHKWRSRKQKNKTQHNDQPHGNNKTSQKSSVHFTMVEAARFMIAVQKEANNLTRDLVPNSVGKAKNKRRNQHRKSIPQGKAAKGETSDSEAGKGDDAKTTPQSSSSPTTKSQQNAQSAKNPQTPKPVPPPQPVKTSKPPKGDDKPAMDRKTIPYVEADHSGMMGKSPVPTHLFGEGQATNYPDWDLYVGVKTDGKGSKFLDFFYFDRVCAKMTNECPCGINHPDPYNSGDKQHPIMKTIYVGRRKKEGVQQQDGTSAKFNRVYDKCNFTPSVAGSHSTATPSSVVEV